jgi:hypothetical protein
MKDWREKMRKQFGVALVSLALIGAAGCGGSNRNSGYSSNRGAGYSAFIAQVNTICTQGDSAVKAANGTSAKLAAVNQFQQKLQNLTPPAQLKAVYAKLVSVSSQGIDAVKSGDAAKAKSLNSQANALASQLGATACNT